LSFVSSKKKVAEIFKKKERIKEEKKSGCLIFEHEIETVRAFFFGRKSCTESPDSPLNSEHFDI